MKKWLAMLGIALLPAGVQGDDHGTFEGAVAVEWLDNDPFIFTFRLMRDFTYRDAKGKPWTVPSGKVIDGKSVPPLFMDRIGHPFDGSFRKAAVVYDYATQTMSEQWPATQHMFYEATLAEGVPSSEAKAMYLMLLAQGSRWEVAGSRCYGSCHGDSSPLFWRPVVDEPKIEELLLWVRANDPPVAEVEQRVAGAILDKGPHVFPIERCYLFSGSTKVGTRCTKEEAEAARAR